MMREGARRGAKRRGKEWNKEVRVDEKKKRKTWRGK